MMMTGWLPFHRPRTEAERREELARRAARVINSYAIPGIGPLTFREIVKIVLLALFLALTLFGMLGAVLPPPHG